MPVLFKRNSLSNIGGGGGGGGGDGVQTSNNRPGMVGQPNNNMSLGIKRPQRPSERDLVLASHSQARGVKLQERSRKKEIEMKHQAASTIQLAWRRYVKRKKIPTHIDDMSRDNIRKKRLRVTQEEWERQIAALTIQLAWRKYFRRKLMEALHPNRRQLQLWDPEIVALKQQALINYIYNEQLIAPFWHPTPKAMARPMWTRFIQSPAAVSYNFAVDQYVPWVARLGGIPFLSEEEEQEVEDSNRRLTQTGAPFVHSKETPSQQSCTASNHSSQSHSTVRSQTRGGNRKIDKKDGMRPKTTVVNKRISSSSFGVRVKS